MDQETKPAGNSAPEAPQADNLGTFAEYEASKQRDRAPSVEKNSSASAPAEEAEADTTVGTPDTPDDQPEPNQEAGGENNGKQPQRKKHNQDRIDELTKHRRTAERERDDFKRKYEELSAKQNQPAANEQPGTQQQASAKTGAAASKPMPKIEDFDDYRQYEPAVQSWVAEQVSAGVAQAAEAARQTVDTHEQRKAQEQQQTQTIERYKARQVEALERYPDFHEKVNAVDVPLSPSMRDLLLTDEQGPDLVYYLADHPEEGQRLFEASNLDLTKATPQQIIAAERTVALTFGRIAGKLAAAQNGNGQAARNPRVSNAPTPIRPSGGRTAATLKSEDEMSFEEFEREKYANKRR